jgi:hypothetical protein
MAARKCIKNDTVGLLFYALNQRIKRSQRAAEPGQDFYVKSVVRCTLSVVVISIRETGFRSRTHV